jgi:hypothetical protein
LKREDRGVPGLAECDRGSPVSPLPFAGPFVAGAAVTGSLAGREIAERILAMRLPKTIALSMTEIVRANIKPTPRSVAVGT